MAAVSRGYLDALRKLPVVDPVAFLAGYRLVVLAPHPDDESLGVGGTLAAAVAAGVAVTVVFLTSGEGSHRGSATYPAHALAATREGEALAALASLGVAETQVMFLGLPDSGLGTLDAMARAAVVARIQALVGGTTPVMLLVTAATDMHGDHRAAAALARSVAMGPADRLYGFPVWTWWQDTLDVNWPTPVGVRLDVAAYLGRKREAIAAHRSQHGEVVTDAAEAFTLDPGFIEAMCSGYETLVAYA
jgi:LmbE family N-acetylglucosaminyl deacetylase